MAQYKDILSSRSGWLHELAKAEIHPDAEKLLQLGRSFDPHQLVEESAVDFLTQLREHFTEYTKVFNGYSEGENRFDEVKIYSVAQTTADFMLYRNRVKLLVSNSAHGIIQIGFSRHDGAGVGMSAVGATSANPEFGVPQEIIAQVGPFRNVHWTFQSERVTSQQVARFYFTEFVRSTRNSQKSKVGNQLLIEEIRTLLKDKGIDL